MKSETIMPLQAYLPVAKSKLTRAKEWAGGLFVKALVYGTGVVFWLFLVLMVWDFCGKLMSNNSFSDKQVFGSVAGMGAVIAFLMLIPIIEKIRLMRRLARVNKQNGTAFTLNNTCGRTTDRMLAIDPSTKQILILPAFGAGDVLPFSYLAAWHHEGGNSGFEMVIQTNDVEQPIVLIPTKGERDAEKWQNKLRLLLRDGDNK